MRPDVQTMAKHRPQYTADTDADEIEVYTHKRLVTAWGLLLPQLCRQ